MIGVLLRVSLSEAFPQPADAWPWPTLVANLAGAFLIGYFFTLLRDHDPDRPHHPFLATGICGTLTTFSTMQLELLSMVDGGETVLAAGYVAVSIGVGYCLLRLGIAAAEARMEAPA